MNKPHFILYKFASRSRKDKFFNCIDNIQRRQKDKENYKILCSLDTDDLTMNNIEVINKLSLYTNVEVCWGTSKNKIDAINRDMDGQEFDILINTSDDMDFVQFGFDQTIRDHMKKYYPDLDGILHYNDGTSSGERVMTLSIMGKKWYDRFNYIYHPDYTSLWSDNEATEVGNILGKRTYFTEVLFHHNHPGHGKAKYDQQYLKTESFYASDKVIFEQRKAKNFDL